MSISKTFKQVTGISLTAYARSVGLRQCEVYTDLKKGYCAWPRIPKDGRTKHPYYQTWVGMNRRCHNITCSDFKYYGGRGIEVCISWRLDFWQFVKDMGPKPAPEYTIERLDNSKGYYPANCIWATRFAQGKNTRKIVYYEKDGIRLSLMDWSRKLNVPYTTLSSRHRRRGNIF